MEPQDGLLLLPSRYTPPIGHDGFDIELTDHRGGRYFDARRARFPIENAGSFGAQTIEHPWNGGPALRFVAGRIHLEAHDGDEFEIYSFGGQANISVEAGRTVCRVTSTAPFLPLSDDPEEPFALLESELEVVMARSRARWGEQEHVHLDHLSHIEPMTLFVASLVTLEERLTTLARTERDPNVSTGLRLVREWRRQLERSGEWPGVAPDMEELL